MNEQITLNSATLDNWADRPGPSALVLKERLTPVEGNGGAIFPATYADIGYNVDILSDGTKIAQIDSVGAQANRMEPLFKRALEGAPDNPLSKLIPQIGISAMGRKLSLLEAGHRLADTIVRCSSLGGKAEEAFSEYMNGDATKLAKLAPTTLVFGAWNSRSEDNQAKIPRIVQSVIRAHDVEILHRAAQYNPAINYGAEDLLGPWQADAEKEARSKRGFHDAPAVWRDSKKSTDDENRVLGGILARGEVLRTVTVNLVVLRSLGGGADHGKSLRRYIFGLSLVAATAPQNGFLRQGCLLVRDWQAPEPKWQAVYPTRAPESLALTFDKATEYAEKAAAEFGVGPDIAAEFDLQLARQELEDKDDAKNQKARKAKK